MNIHWKDWRWSWNSNTLTTWCKELIPWKRPWCWETLRAGGEGDSRGWDGWMASLTQRTWVWTSSKSWWWTGKPNMLHSMGLQRVGHDWATELNWVSVLRALYFFLFKINPIHLHATVSVCMFCSWSSAPEIRTQVPISGISRESGLEVGPRPNNYQGGNAVPLISK